MKYAMVFDAIGVVANIFDFVYKIYQNFLESVHSNQIDGAEFQKGLFKMSENQMIMFNLSTLCIILIQKGYIYMYFYI